MLVLLQFFLYLCCHALSGNKSILKEGASKGFTSGVQIFTRTILEGSRGRHNYVPSATD